MGKDANCIPVMAFIIVIAMLLIAPCSYAEIQYDFGYSFIEAGDIYMGRCSNDNCFIDISTLKLNFDANEIDCAFVNGLMGYYTIRPSTGNIEGFRLSCPKERIGSLAFENGFIIGRMGTVLLHDDNEPLASATDQLGIGDNDVYNKDSYFAEARIDGIIYKFEIVDGLVSFEMYVGNKEADDSYKPIDAAEKIMKDLFEQSNIKDFSYFTFNAENDPNASLGDEGSYYSKVNFALQCITGESIEPTPQIGIEQGGAIEVFSNPHDAEKFRSRMFQVSYLMPENRQIVMSNGNIVLRLSTEIPSDVLGAITSSFYTLYSNS